MLFIEVISKMEKGKDRALWFTVKTGSTKGSGIMTIVRGKGTRFIRMIISMKATLRKGKLMEKECTIGPTAKSMTANGAAASKMATACGEEFSVTHT